MEASRPDFIYLLRDANGPQKQRRLLHHGQAEPAVISMEEFACFNHNGFLIVSGFPIGTDRASKMY